MNTNLIKGITAFVEEDFNTVYGRCYFRLTEDVSAIIYEDTENDILIRMSVDIQDDDSQMTLEDLKSGEVTVMFVSGDNKISCEDDNVNDEVCDALMHRYLQYMDSFVQFAKAD